MKLAKTKALIAASLLATLLCTGCEVGMSFESKPAENPIDAATEKGMVGQHVEAFRLKDGTRCITWQSGAAGGVSCDWQQAGERSKARS